MRACLLATSGASPALFAPEKAFYALVRQQIQRLRDPGLECVDLVCRELENCARRVMCGARAPVANHERCAEDAGAGAASSIAPGAAPASSRSARPSSRLYGRKRTVRRKAQSRI